MLLSRKWLNEFVPVEAKDRAFAEDMTLSGSKVEVTEVEGEEISNVVVGRVVEIKRHENSDHMWICQVDVGEGTPLQIVTGAQNVSQGDLVPVAKDNSTLPGGIHIKKGTLRGVESNGMLCSYKELGMTDNDWPYSVVDGIFLLESDPDLKAKGLKPGDDIRTAIGLDDHVVEFEITPNRPDCLSVIGLAREAAVTYGKALTLHDPVVNGGGPGNLSDLLDVEIPATDLCPRYTARMVRNVKIGPSPKWMRDRLRASGVRPINNIVDITNYVMLEYGQPMHAFDYRYVKGGKIIVRRAEEGETLTTLDGNVRNLMEPPSAGPRWPWACGRRPRQNLRRDWISSIPFPQSTGPVSLWNVWAQARFWTGSLIFSTMFPSLSSCFFVQKKSMLCWGQRSTRRK